MRSISLRALAVAFALHLVIIVVLSWRWKVIAAAAGGAFGWTTALRMTFSSTLANLTLPTSVAGDAGRVWFVQNHGLNLFSSILVGAFDRVIGLATLMAIVLIGQAVVPGLVPNFMVWIISATLAALVAALVVHGVLQPSKTGSAGLPGPADVLRPYPFLMSLIASLAGHLLAVLIAMKIAGDVSDTLTFGSALVLFPAVLFAASLPISIGGWGMRELAAIAVFPLIGMTAEAAVALTLVFGLTQTAAAGFGTIVLALVRTGPQQP